MKNLFKGACVLAAATALMSTSALAQGPKHVAVIIKATNSDFWQALLVGARNYAKEHPDAVTVTTNGPPAEADIAQQVSILENTVAQHPDGILLASTSSEATVPAINKAVAAGIPVVTVDNKVKTDKVSSFLATNNIAAGKLAAKAMVDAMKAAGKPLKGKVAIISAMAGVQVLTDRDKGFEEGMKAEAPHITVMKARYVNNDVLKAANTAQDLITSNPDLVGIFADNNATGDGTARVVESAGNKIVAVAFDSDAQEVDALKKGTLSALVVQDPYGMGYKGVQYVLDALAGKKLPDYVDTGAAVVTKANMGEKKYAEMLDPLSRAMK